MSISIEKISQLFNSLQKVLGAPVGNDFAWDAEDIPKGYACLLSDYTEKEITAATLQLAASLRHFPFPIDFIEVMDARRKAETISSTQVPDATESVAAKAHSARARAQSEHQITVAQALQ